MNTYEELIDPAMKLSDLKSFYLKKTIDSQRNLSEAYVKLAEKRFESAKTFKGVSSLNNFLLNNVEFTQESVEQMMQQRKGLVADAKSYNEALITVLQEGNNVITDYFRSAIKSSL